MFSPIQKCSSAIGNWEKLQGKREKWVRDEKKMMLLMMMVSFCSSFRAIPNIIMQLFPFYVLHTLPVAATKIRHTHTRTCYFANSWMNHLVKEKYKEGKSASMIQQGNWYVNDHVIIVIIIKTSNMSKGGMVVIGKWVKWRGKSNGRESERRIWMEGEN